MRQLSHEQLYANLTAGKVYRRSQLLSFSNALDRDLDVLVKQGLLEKVSSGMYYKPNQSQYGVLPPSKDDLVKTFLRDDQYLMFSLNDYNALGLGLTQLYNRTIVYNYKRFCQCEMGGLKFDFRRPSRGFPKKVTPEYLLVDLVNNLKLLAEDSEAVKGAIVRRLKNFDKSKVMQMAKKYGKVTTRHFFEGLSDESKNVFTRVA